jgi:hypothetical protein
LFRLLIKLKKTSHQKWYTAKVQLRGTRPLTFDRQMRNIGKKILMQSERYGVKALSIGSTGISALLPCLYVAVPVVLQSGRGMTVEGAVQ